MFDYAGKVVRIVDGDTLIVRVDLGFYITQEIRLRLRGIDAPEPKGITRQAGLKATEFVETELAGDPELAIRTYKIGKWGRFIADVFYAPSGSRTVDVFKNGTHLNQRLLEEGHAKPAPL